MSWINLVWPMTTSACLMLALIHGFIWLQQRSVLPNLLFALTAAGTVAIAGCELAMMRAATPEEFGAAIRWGHVPVLLVVVLLAWFVRLYLQAGHVWLGWTACVLRMLSLVANFTSGENLNYSEIIRLRHIRWFGESVSMAIGVPNRWMLLGQLSLFLLVVFVADAAIHVWRSGDRSRATMVGGSIVFFLLAGAVETALVSWGFLNWPITVSPFFVGFVAAMGYELSREALRAQQLTRELRESEYRMAQASEAANVGIWSWDLAREEIWANNQWRELFGLTKLDQLDLATFLQPVHPDDREPLRKSLAQAIEGCGGYENEYRVTLPKIGLRWIALRGAVEVNSAGKPVYMRGVAQDITLRKQSELELQSHRDQLAHLLRVASLGELSSALAHELNQPLTAILSNAQAARRFLERDNFDPVEIREILADIVADDQRAGEVIRRLRTLVKKSEFKPEAVEVNDLILDVLKLMKGDLTARTVSVVTDFTAGLPPISGDRVQLQQVLINLVLNAGEALSHSAANTRLLTLGSSRGESNAIHIFVADTGGGFPPGDEEKIFEPYHTTKAAGLGLGLSLSRSILAAHGGRLWADNQPGRGAKFHLILPEWKERRHERSASVGDSISC